MSTPTGYDPTGDLPDSLKNMLGVLMSNGLRSWQIYSEASGVTVKIRFWKDKQNGGQSNERSQMSYVRKPPAQLRRDTRKAEEF